MINRFVYLTDTHIGQPRKLANQWRCTDLIEPLLDALADWMGHHPVDFVLHGGDIVVGPTPERIEAATRLFERLGVPTWLCLGNHDLERPEAIDTWRRHRHGLLPEGEPDYGFDFDQFRLFVVANHYTRTDRPYFYATDQSLAPFIDDAQVSRMDRFIGTSDKPVIVASHWALAPSWLQIKDGTGIDPAYIGVFTDLGQRHDTLKLVLTAHIHANTCCRHGSFTSMSTAAFAECPFEFRYITVDAGVIRVETVSLRDAIHEPSEYLQENAWVQGTPEARLCIIS